jgi:hypothetical protein
MFVRIRASADPLDLKVVEISLRASAPASAARTTLALTAGLSVMPAAADHCPPGQFYRVRLNQCVGLNTRLASAYVHIAASRLATPGRAEKVAPRAEPGAGPVGQPEVRFVLPTLDWPVPK